MEKQREYIATLLQGIDRYNPENLSKLEKYVEYQAENEFSDLEANLAVLKLYQFNPIYTKKPIINLIVLISMTQMPSSDFILCKALIDYNLYDITKCVGNLNVIMDLATYLDTCNFKKFWDELEKNPSIHTQVKGFISSVKQFICKVLNNTFLHIHADELTKFLGNVSDKELKEMIIENQWKRHAGGEIFLRNQDHILRTKNIKEMIAFENVAEIMARGLNVCK